MPTLIVIARTNNTGAAAMVATNSSLSPVQPLTTSFSQVVTNAYANPDGFTVAYHYTRPSQTGVVSIPLQPGFYSVSDQSSSSNNQTNTLGQLSSSSPSSSSSSTPLSSYTPTYSGDCRTVRSLEGSMVGYGQINIGETKTCIVTYVFHR
jgi:hypothetical protein